ncbi:MAG: sodium:solute symporter [Solirubrobacteraceae bacterium]
MISPFIVLFILVLYFLMLFFISKLASKDSTDETFFTGNRKSPWFIVAVGMIGTAISGVTFVSLPGSVLNNSYHYGQFILGNIFGYLFVMIFLIPIYYKLKLVSIYTYLEKRFGWYSYKTGSFIFIVSRSFGAALRMLLAIKILSVFFKDWNLSFLFIGIISMILVFLYTYKSGVKTLVYTDFIQTIFLISAALFVVITIYSQLNMSFGEIITIADQKNYLNFFDFDWRSKQFFWKQFISGILIAIAMTGLDQDMMQKGLTISNVKDSQKNTFFFSFFVAIVQILFLFLGVLLFIYADHFQITLPIKDGIIETDKVFPEIIKRGYFGTLTSIIFILGVSAAAFASFDSALTSLTTSFSYDFLNIEKRKNQKTIKNMVHIGFSIFLLIIMMFFSEKKGDIFGQIFSLASYTYSPLLGIFMLGVFTKKKWLDWSIPIACILGPINAYFLNSYLKNNFNFDAGFITILTGSILTILIILLINILFHKKNSTK